MAVGREMVGAAVVGAAVVTGAALVVEGAAVVVAGLGAALVVVVGAAGAGVEPPQASSRLEKMTRQQTRATKDTLRFILHLFIQNICAGYRLIA